MPDDINHAVWKAVYVAGHISTKDKENRHGGSGKEEVEAKVTSSHPEVKKRLVKMMQSDVMAHMTVRRIYAKILIGSCK